MKKLFYIPVIAVLVFASACGKYLDIQPNDKFLEEQVYQSELGIKSVLNGIYMRMMKEFSYGGAMTMADVEYLGQQFMADANHAFNTYPGYQYADDKTKGRMNKIWSESYVTILNINKFLEGLNRYPGVVPVARERIMRGEAYGLRAMHHFDMLRLFGPMYSTVDSINLSIPYYSNGTAKTTPILPANAVMDSVLRDIDLALSYLAEDPIKNMGKTNILTNEAISDADVDGLRQLHFNYNAALVLKARVLLYRGNKAEAYQLAKDAITEVLKFNYWVQATNIIGITGATDKVFSTEIVFGVYNQQMVQAYQRYYDPELTDNNILLKNDTRLTSTTFEGLINDYRLKALWMVPSSGAKASRTFFKYAGLTDKTLVRGYVVPMLRMSELFYIVAETTTDKTEALTYLNTVRQNRGIDALGANATVETELRKEYQKEFIGEGQLFFYYKRKGTTPIVNATTGANVTMNKSTYVVPLPESETNVRN
ncbi:SusD-like starch-binding protein associating with outer membrane [Chitinophaga skermanii]|uniref:SusD-like starch-binding protein associating with outer membrane n=1 Tax=Chitinophaga skermanii TaxID=331697 RepID=A0A327QX04_9BACT|nr:RagB/SusD family nutrient uptake outer membrane protein [Chitinophaga skermanii]RAJ08495.1 SusD-like starch-binding protein associating with outer membrane [Chitinophaga skermanii]